MVGRGDLFLTGRVLLASKQESDFKIECEALTDGDLQTLALQIAKRFAFGAVEGVPTGGLRLAAALAPYALPGRGLLIVDDVLTTGASMERQRAGRPAFGVVLFARRRPTQDWIVPLFQMLT